MEGRAWGKERAWGSLECGLSEKGSQVLKEQVLAIESRATPLKHEAKQKPKIEFQSRSWF